MRTCRSPGARPTNLRILMFTLQIASAALNRRNAVRINVVFSPIVCNQRFPGLRVINNGEAPMKELRVPNKNVTGAAYECLALHTETFNFGSHIPV